MTFYILLLVFRIFDFVYIDIYIYIYIYIYSKVQHLYFALYACVLKYVPDLYVKIWFDSAVS